MDSGTSQDTYEYSINQEPYLRLLTELAISKGLNVYQSVHWSYGICIGFESLGGMFRFSLWITKEHLDNPVEITNRFNIRVELLKEELNQAMAKL